MDPAIMSTSVNFGKNVGVSSTTNSNSNASLSQQQQELFARFNQLSVQPNGVKLHGNAAMGMGALGSMASMANMGSVGGGAGWGQKLGWGVGYAGIPLPPGFAPAKPAQHPAECIDAK